MFSLSNLKPFDFKYVLSDAFSPAVQIKTPLMIFQPKQATCKTNTWYGIRGNTNGNSGAITISRVVTIKPKIFGRTTVRPTVQGATFSMRGQ